MGPEIHRPEEPDVKGTSPVLWEVPGSNPGRLPDPAAAKRRVMRLCCNSRTPGSGAEAAPAQRARRGVPDMPCQV